jgi:hypothetical protein
MFFTRYKNSLIAFLWGKAKKILHKFVKTFTKIVQFKFQKLEWAI